MQFFINPGGLHSHFYTFTCIENTHPLSSAFCLNHPQPLAFFLMQTILSRRTFSQEEKKRLAVDLSKQICHRINYVWVIKFKSVFRQIMIVQSFETISSQRQMLKNICRYHMNSLLRDTICTI